MIINAKFHFKQGDIMKIAELVEALEAVRALAGECDVTIHGSGSKIYDIQAVEVIGKPGALNCAIKSILLTK